MKRKRVAIIGGGCAAMAAAFELTKPELEGEFDVTVYQVGWRLGGKGASGRGANGRIEEHGLHLWMGFYENAFRLMRECFAELPENDVRYCDLSDFPYQSFEPAPLVGVTDQLPDGNWDVWKGILPAIDGQLPGDPTSPTLPTAPEYFQRVTQLVSTLLQTLMSGSAMPSADRGANSGEQLARLAQRALRIGPPAALIEASNILQTIARRFDGAAPQQMAGLAADIHRRAAGLLADVARDDIAAMRVWHVLNLALATLRGEIAERIPWDPRGFDVIDDVDCRKWLKDYGGTDDAINSGFVRGLYDLGFSFLPGASTQRSVSAGQALRGMARSFFTYRGSFFWRMTAGMGDVVFAPLYQVLKQRGVRFDFFHRLENVGVGKTDRIQSLTFDVQAVPKADEYAPLVDVGGLPCWPSQPIYDNLRDGQRLRAEQHHFESFWDRRKHSTRTLVDGDDFDFVVLGIGIGAIPQICPEILDRDPRWRNMTTRVQSVATQAFQIWMNQDMQSLGWNNDGINVSGFVEPFDTWADMGHLISKEQWSEAPKSLAYFCNVLDDVGNPFDRSRTEYREQRYQQVRKNAITFLNRDVGHLWPNAANGNGFRWELLAGKDDGGHRFDSQYWTANVNPSDRYSLSLPGTSADRISPLDGMFENLTIAGDWTNCGFNAGCVEAAVMSGRLAAHALSRSPKLEEITGYDHP